MVYTVGEMAKVLGVPASTLRYYDKEGLLPFVERSSGGVRLFQEKDFEWLRIIGCLKKAGMSLKDIREYIKLMLQGDDTINERLALFQKQKLVLQAQMEELQQTMDTLDFKCWYYETAKKAGTVDVMQDITLEDVPAELQATWLKLHDVPGSAEAEEQKLTEAV